MKEKHETEYQAVKIILDVAKGFKIPAPPVKEVYKLLEIPGHILVELSYKLVLQLLNNEVSLDDTESLTLSLKALRPKNDENTFIIDTKIINDNYPKHIGEITTKFIELMSAWHFEVKLHSASPRYITIAPSRDEQVQEQLSSLSYCPAKIGKIIIEYLTFTPHFSVELSGQDSENVATLEFD